VMEMRGPSPKAGFARREARGRLRRHKHKPSKVVMAGAKRLRDFRRQRAPSAGFDRAGRSPARCRARATEWARCRSESQC